MIAGALYNISVDIMDPSFEIMFFVDHIGSTPWYGKSIILRLSNNVDIRSAIFASRPFFNEQRSRAALMIRSRFDA